MYKPGDNYSKEFITSSPTTGAAADADSLPVATADFDGTGTGSMVLTVTSLDTGRYKITGTIPAGRVPGDVLNISVTATVSGVAGKAVVDTRVLDSKRVGDLNDAAPATIAVAVRDVDNTTPAANSLGAHVNSAASAGDPWGTTLPGSYPVGSAGAILGGTIPANVIQVNDQAIVGTTTVMANVTEVNGQPITDTAIVDANVTQVNGQAITSTTTVDANVTEVNGQPVTNTTLNTDASGNAISVLAASQPDYAPAKAGDAMVLTTAERGSMADALLGRSIAGGADGGRTVRDAFRVLRNKVDLVAGIVYLENDVSPAWTFSTTTTPGQEPITAIDPA